MLSIFNRLKSTPFNKAEPLSYSCNPTSGFMKCGLPLPILPIITKLWSKGIFNESPSYILLSVPGMVKSISISSVEIPSFGLLIIFLPFSLYLVKILKSY